MEVRLPRAPERGYEILIGDGCLREQIRAWAEGSTVECWAVVCDEAVADGPGAVVRDSLGVAGGVLDLRVPSGEASKSRETVARLQDEAIDGGLGRDGAVVAVGGGVVGDVAGFAAATLFRGVDCVQVPTTLLAMVDSAVGGKTGVDTPGGKNLVGAFHQPAHVVVDVDTLSTLPGRFLRAGLAEVVKYGVILDEQLFIDLEDGLLESCLSRVPAALMSVVERCLTLKAEVVAADETESGRRQILNFGHTVAHAIEAASEFELTHGEAVAVGMVVEARLATGVAGADPSVAGRIAELLGRADLPVEPPPELAPDRLVRLAGRDKKVRAGRLRCALPVEIGRMAGAEQGWSLEVGEAELREALAARSA